MQWIRKHAHNLEWFERLAAAGSRVKALENRPELFEVETFYLDMYQLCGTDFQNIRTYCELHGLCGEQILESIHIAALVASEVEKHASNPA